MRGAGEGDERGDEHPGADAHRAQVQNHRTGINKRTLPQADIYPVIAGEGAHDLRAGPETTEEFAQDVARARAAPGGVGVEFFQQRDGAFAHPRLGGTPTVEPAFHHAPPLHVCFFARKRAAGAFGQLSDVRAGDMARVARSFWHFSSLI